MYVHKHTNIDICTHVYMIMYVYGIYIYMHIYTHV